MRRPLPNRLSQPGSLHPALWALLAGMMLAIATIAVVITAFVVGASRQKTSKGFSTDHAVQGSFAWDVLGIGFGAIFAVFVVGILLWLAVSRMLYGKVWIDERARYMARPADLAGLSEAAQAAESERLGASDVGTGVPIGIMVKGSNVLKSSYEWVRIAVLGPRAGKTSALAIREVLESKGPTLATSNKRDLVDATRGPRSELGIVYVHDIQNLVGEKPNWWWSPLSFVKDLETATRLVDVFAASATEKDARSDAYFSTAAKDYLSALVLAAAIGEQPMSRILHWMQRPELGGPVELLTEAGLINAARNLKATLDLTPKQRDGVIGTALPWVSFLNNPNYLAWIEQMPGEKRPHFNPAIFVSSKADTIYLVSKEGSGSARAITAALTMAILDAADKLGSTSPGMRLPRPLGATLDEAANVVRLPELPDLYSHYGSRGIILSVYLQSWTQGVAAWGENGMKKMWSAANVRLVGAGVAEVPFLREISDLVGERDKYTSSRSVGRGGGSTSRSVSRERILDTSEVGKIPPWRALLFTSGNPPTLVELVPWWKQPYADKVKASKNYYESAATQGGKR
ncbi:type IV secretory system conjugative DNA transfer family protein [Dermabacteraceae bacterium P13115]